MQTKNNGSELDAIFQDALSQNQNQKGAGARDWRQDDTAAAADALQIKLAAARQALPGAAIGSLLIDCGKQAARIQARRLINLRGVEPSQTSIDDAAADGTAGAVKVGLRLLRFGVDLGKDYTARVRGGRLVKRSARGLCLLYANRAAFRSLCAWASVGVTGTESDKFTGGAFVEEFTLSLRDSLAAPSGDLGAVESVAARWRVARWLYRVGVQAFAAALPGDQRGAARAAAVAAAVQRVRTVADCLFGLPLVESIAANGFTSGAAFVNSCRAADFFPTLARAATGAGDVAAARASMRRAALVAAESIKAQRATHGGARRMTPAAVKVVSVWSRGRGRRLVARRFGNGDNGRAAWSVAAAARASAVEMAVWWRGVAARRAADNAAAFKLVLQGVRGGTFGDLGKVFKTSRRSSKLHSLFIRRNPSGAVSRRAGAVGVAGKVGRAARMMPCAVGGVGAVVPVSFPFGSAIPAANLRAVKQSRNLSALVAESAGVTLDKAARAQARADATPARAAVAGVVQFGKLVKVKQGGAVFVTASAPCVAVK